MTAILDPEQTETRFIHDFANLDGANVLEVGCGDGRLTWRYATQASRVTAIDLDPIRLAQAIAARPADLRDRVRLLKASALDLPFRKETFDRAILAWSL